MTRQKLSIGFVAAAFTLSLAPAVWAQAGSRPNTTGSSSGSAEPRGGGGSSAGSSSSGSSTSSGSGGSGGGSSMGSSSSDSPRGRARESAPVHPSQGAVRRGSASGDRATVRGSGANASPSADGQSRGRSRAEVPAYSRPRDGRNVTGTAMERRNPIPGGSGGSIYYPGINYGYDPFYSGYYGSYYSRYGYYPYSRYWVPGYGFGLGYFAYDPFMFGGYDYYGGSYGGGYASGGYSSQSRDIGNLRLKINPKHTQVYVDGYFVGDVDSFDGIFQRLGIEAGAHRVELRAEGYETVEFEVLITPGQTVTYKGDLKPRQP